MPGVSRKTVDTAGGPIKDGSSSVFVNGSGAVVIGASVTQHGSAPHAKPTLNIGSGTVFVNGKPLVRSGDKATCGHAATGSSNVSAGG